MPPCYAARSSALPHLHLLSLNESTVVKVKDIRSGEDHPARPTTASSWKEEFALNGEGRNGITLALYQYQQKIDQTIREMEGLRVKLATKEKQLANAQPMPKDPPGSYWQWDSPERSGRIIYNPQSKSSHDTQSVWWKERYMQQERADGEHLQRADGEFRMLPTPVSGTDPYPGDGVVVQSLNGILYVPSRLIRSMFNKATSGLTADKGAKVEDGYQGLHEKLGFILEHLQNSPHFEGTHAQ